MNRVVIIFLSICILGGCKSGVKVMNLDILHANALIEAHPDSTLAILASINLDSLPENAQMHWYLLHEYASLKLWKPVSPDTIMPIVVDYFQRIGDKKHLCEALYVQGAEYEHTLRVNNAMWCLKEAEQYIPYLDTVSSVAGLIYYIEGAIFESEMLFHLSLEKYLQALPYYQQAGDTKRAAYCCRDIARMLSESNDSTQTIYYDMAMDYALQQHDTLVYLSTLWQKEYNLKLCPPDSLLKISLYLVDSLYKTRYAHYPTEYYIRHREAEKAQTYLQLFSQDTAFLDWSREKYNDLQSQLLYQENEPALAYDLLQQVYRQFRQRVKQDAHVRTYLISRQYDLEKEQQKTLRLTISRQRLWITIGAGASVFIIILLIVLFIYHHKRMLHRQKEQAMQANILALNAELNEKRNALRQQLHQRMDMAKHLHVEDISAKLPRKVRDYLEQIVFTKEKNWQELRQNFNALYGGLLEHLRTEHPLLTTQDEQVIVLGVLGFSNSDIAFLLNISDRTIWNRRQKIRDRLGDPQMDLDQWFSDRAALPTPQELSAYFHLSRVGD